MIWLYVCVAVSVWVVLAALVAAFFRVTARLDELLEEDVEAALHPLGNVTVLDEYRRQK